MHAGLLNNLVPLPNLSPAGTNGSQNHGVFAAGEEGAFQLLLESMLFEVVAGQVLKDGKGLLAGLSLGLTEEEGDETRGQDLLALLSMLQGPLLEHFRETQPQLKPIAGEPVFQGKNPQVPALPLNGEAEAQTLAALAGERQEVQSPMGKELNLSLQMNSSFREVLNQEPGHRLHGLTVNNPGMEYLIQDNPDVHGLNGDHGSKGEKPLPESLAGRENNFLNLMLQEQPRQLENLNQAASFRQPAQAGNILAFSEVAEQIVQSGKLKVLGEKHEIEIQLKPEYLGKLAIRLSLENGVMTARFLIENHQVARMVDSNLPQLKQTLEDQGVRFDQVQVEVGDPGSSFQERHQDWQQRGHHPAPLTFPGEQAPEETGDDREIGRQGRIDYRA